MPRKNGDLIVFDIARREGDHIVLGEDGLRILRSLVSSARKKHSKWLDKHNKGTQEWNRFLKKMDKTIEKIVFSTKKVIVEVDWEKWYPIEKEILREQKRMLR